MPLRLREFYDHYSSQISLAIILLFRFNSSVAHSIVLRGCCSAVVFVAAQQLGLIAPLTAAVGSPPVVAAAGLLLL
jgi:hypothetical protein